MGEFAQRRPFRDFLSYQHSETDVTQPYLLFGNYKVEMKIWDKFRRADKRWRGEAMIWRRTKLVDVAPDHPDFQEEPFEVEMHHQWHLARNWLTSTTIKHYDRARGILWEDVFGGPDRVTQQEWSELHWLLDRPDNKEADQVYRQHDSGEIAIETSDLNAWYQVRAGLEDHRDRHILEAYVWGREEVGAKVEMYQVYVGDLDYDLKVFNTRIDRRRSGRERRRRRLN